MFERTIRPLYKKNKDLSKQNKKNSTITSSNCNCNINSISPNRKQLIKNNSINSKKFNIKMKSKNKNKLLKNNKITQMTKTNKSKSTFYQDYKVIKLQVNKMVNN